MKKIYKSDRVSPGHWKVISGLIVSKALMEDGKEVFLSIYGSEEYLPPYPPPLNSVNYYQECHSQTAELEAIADRSPYGLIASKLEMMIFCLQIRPIKERMKFFLESISSHGRRCSQGVVLPRITHAEIADSISTTRVTVTRTLLLLEEEGYLRRDRRDIVLLQNLSKVA